MSSWSNRTAAVRAIAWGLGLYLVARVDWLTERLPSLSILQGPLGLVLIVVSALVAFAHLLDGAGARLRVPGPLALVLVSAVLTLGLGLHYTGKLRVTGDEPHYLLMAQSIWGEGDLDLQDNYAREDFKEYTPGPIRPHYGAPRADGRPFPAHSPGLSLLLAPAYALGARPGTVLILVLAAGALGWQIWELAFRLTGSARAAAWSWGVAAGAPLALFAFHVYTAIPATLALVSSLRILLRTPLPAPLSAGAAAALAAALPWLHLKMVPAALALGLIGLWRLRGRALLAFSLVAGLMAAGFLGYYWSVFGSPNPLAIYGGVPRGTTMTPRGAAALGLLLDRSFGLLPHAPGYLLALAGALTLARPKRLGEIAPHLLVAGAVLWPVVTWRMWWGGQCPPGRFLVPLVPFLSLAVAARVAEPLHGMARWRWTLVGLSCALLAFMTRDPGGLMLVNRGSRPTRVWAALSGETPVARYLPSLVSGTPEEWRVALVWVAVLGGMLVLDRLARRRAFADRLFRGVGLPAALLLTVGVLVDGWARPPRASSRAPHAGHRAEQQAPAQADAVSVR